MIEVKFTDRKQEYPKISGYINEKEIFTLYYSNDKWKVGFSTNLPTSLPKALKILECEIGARRR